jgi:hypothetical protein
MAVHRSWALLVVALAPVACGGGGSSVFPDQGASGSATSGAGGAQGSGTQTSGSIIVPPNDASQGGGGSQTLGDGGDYATGCASVSGTVMTPGKTDPLYNAVVYIAKGIIDPIASGASCDRCGSLSASKAITATLTGPDGKFKLKGVPVGSGLPLVIQLGKWRRVVPIDVSSCNDAPLSADLTRLPKNQGEGNIPLTAISTGGADSLECILRKMGIDDAEFTVPSSSGRIHMYHATGAVAASGTTPNQTELWTNLDILKRYDMVLLPCEHAPNTDGKAPGYTNLVEYTSLGGRAFITHYNYTWIRVPTTSFDPTANWTSETKYFGNNYDFPMTASVNVGFPKGKDFAQWLVNVGASPSYGSIELNHVVHNSVSVIPNVATPWLTSDAQQRQYLPDGSMISQQILHHYTFNTPIGAAADKVCGRVVYSAFHVNDASSDNKAFPTECDMAALTPQEKVLMFMLFDLASCVQTDSQPPAPPIVR